MGSLRKLAVLAALLGVCGCFRMDLSLWGSGGKAGKGAVAAGGAGGGSPPATQSSPAGPSGGSWTDIVRQYANGTFMGGEHGVLFFALDTLAYPREPADLAVKVVSARSLKPVPGVTVAICREEWVAGRVVTQSDGTARLRWTPREAGNYTFTAKIVAVGDEDHKDLLQVTPTEMLVAVRPKDTRFVVIDLDRTIVDSGFRRVLLDGGRPMADSVAVTNRISQRYGVIYLTHRLDVLTRRSKQWLKANGYPPGPLLVSTMKDVMDSAAFKTARLSELRKAFPNVEIGIGDKPSDAQAYADNGMTAYLIPHYKSRPKDMRETAKEVRSLRPNGRIQVVADWRQIDEGIFRGASFPPSLFSAALEARADRLEAEPRPPKGRAD
jgi:hypothetical protein